MELKGRVPRKKLKIKLLLNNRSKADNTRRLI